MPRTKPQPQYLIDEDSGATLVRYEPNGFNYFTSPALVIAESANAAGHDFDQQSINRKAFQHPLSRLNGRPC